MLEVENLYQQAGSYDFIGQRVQNSKNCNDASFPVIIGMSTLTICKEDFEQ